MENIFDSAEYQEARTSREEYFKEENLVFTKTIEFGDYSLVVESYKTGEGYWNFTRGKVYYKDELIADVKRNYGSFHYRFIDHDNGNTYLVCGEDYQGYTIVNCTQRTVNTFIPEEWLKGWGFCWIETDIDLSGNELIVEGCYWGAPYERVIYDFSNPDVLPLPELRRSCLDPEPDDEEEDDI